MTRKGLSAAKGLKGQRRGLLLGEVMLEMGMLERLFMCLNRLAKLKDPRKENGLNEHLRLMKLGGPMTSKWPD